MRSHARLFAVLSVLAAIVMVVPACGSTPTPQVQKETVVVTQVVPQTVEKVVQQTVEVTKVVEKTVEKVVEVTPTPAPGAKKVTLDFVIGTEPPTIDPALSTDTTSVWLVHQMFLGLTGYNDQTLEVEPVLAKSWDVSQDGKTYTFHLRNDAKWVKLVGDTPTEVGPVTAKDVVYGILRTLNPSTGSSYAYVLTSLIVGAEEYNSADPTKLSADEMQKLHDAVGVTAPDDQTVVINLKQPAAYFPAVASLWVCRPQPKDAIETYGDRWIEPGLIVTNGPYLLKEWSHGSHITLIKNPFWYNADQVQIEVLQAPIVTEESTAMAMYENGEIDYMGDPGWGPPLPDMDRIKSDPVLSKELKILPRLCTYYYGFVLTKPPMDNDKVRKAFSLAIDRQTIIDTLLKGEQQPANSFTGPGIFGNVAGDPDVGFLYDPAKAKQMLADAGYPDGKGFPKVTLMLNQSEAHMQIAQAIQAMWKQVLNVDVNIEQQEWKVYLQTLLPSSPDADKPEIYRMGWCADYMDANNYLNDVFNSKSDQNYAKFNDPEYDKIVQQAQVEQDPAKRKELYKQAEIILNNKVTAIAPIYFYTKVNLQKPYMTIITNPLSMDNVWKWKIDVAAKDAARKK